MAHRFPSWVSALAASLLASPALAAPRILAVFPTGGQRGTRVTITLQGDGLKDLSGFFPLGKGLTATMLPGGKDDLRTATVAIAGDAPLGRQEVRFYDAAALSNARQFSVGAFPEIAEVEPNNTREKAQPVSLPVTINARLPEYSELDGYKVALKAGETMVCEVEGLRVLGQVGDSWLKGYLEIQNASGKVLASSQGVSDDYYRWDPLIVFKAPADGEYTVWFRDLNWRGDMRSVYRLTLSAQTHLTGIFPLGGKRGTTVPVSFVGPYCPPTPQPTAILPDAADPMQVSLVTATASTNARPFQPSDFDDAFQTAGNQSLASAQAVTIPCVVNGRFSAGARDYYAFTLAAKQTVCVEVYSRRLGTLADPEVTLFDSKGNLFALDDDSKGRDAALTRELGPGRYTVCVRDVDERGGPEFGYRLFLTPPRPSLKAVVAPDSFSVARGQSVALPVTLERVDGANGDVVVSLSDAPAGISAAPVTIPAGKNDGALTVSVAPGAAAGPIRLTVTALSGALRATATGSETYNIQGTAYQRDRLGPVLFVREK